MKNVMVMVLLMLTPINAEASRSRETARIARPVFVLSTMYFRRISRINAITIMRICVDETVMFPRWMSFFSISVGNGFGIGPITGSARLRF